MRCGTTFFCFSAFCHIATLLAPVERDTWRDVARRESRRPTRRGDESRDCGDTARPATRPRLAPCPWAWLSHSLDTPRLLSRTSSVISVTSEYSFACRRVLACSLAADRAGPEGFACRVGLTGLVAPASAATLLGWVWCVCDCVQIVCVPGPLECVCVGLMASIRDWPGDVTALAVGHC